MAELLDDGPDDRVASAYLRLAESLGLTPKGRQALGIQAQQGQSGGGKLARLQSIAGGRGA